MHRGRLPQRAGAPFCATGLEAMGIRAGEKQVSFENDHTRAPAWSAPERKHFRWCLGASAFLFVIYAIFSTGDLHPDEYFQTVEFASSKLGITDAADLAWEYR